MRRLDSNRYWYGALCLVLMGILAGCAAEGPRRGTLHFGMDDAPEGKRVYFPGGNEIPRFFFAGQLVGEQNFKSDAAAGNSRGFFKWLSDLIVGEDAPRVIQRPQSVAYDEASGRIFVSDVSRAAVWVFDPKDGVLLEWSYARETVRFRSPTGLSVGPDGVLYVVDSDLGFVARLSPGGDPLPPFGAGMFKRPNGVVYDPVGMRIFVADTGAHDIKVFDQDGRLVQSYGTPGERLGEFNAPTYLALRRGELYVADTNNARVQVLDAETGVARRAIGGRGLLLGQMVRPKGVSVDSEGNIYVIESMHDHLLVYNNVGEFLLPIGGTGPATGNFYLPAGLAIDSKDRVFVADTFNGRVTILQFLGGDLRDD